MNKNSLYIVIFGLLFLLVLLLGISSMLTKMITSRDNPVTTPTPIIAPTSSYRAPTRAPTLASDFGQSGQENSWQNLSYPVRYDTVIIDYVSSKNQMIVYYPAARSEGETLYRQFLDEYKVSASTRLNLNVEYIGLEREAKEPAPGTPLVD